MDINLLNYLSEDKIREIIEDELRAQIRKYFNHEEDGKRLLSNISYQIVFDEVDKTIPNSKEFIAKKTEELIKEKNFEFMLFRDGSYGSKKSLAYEYIESAVKDNKDVINEKVKDTIINNDYSKEIWNKFEELGETFIDNIYEITRLGREKNDKQI